MAKYNYGKTFKKNGKLMRYRYTNKRKSSKKLVAVKWQRMNRDALDESPSVKPRFLDFKVYADAAHHAAGIGANLLPINFAGPATPGEWFSSKAVIPVAAGAVEGAVNEFEFVATGANFPGAGASGLNAISLIEGYANSRGLPYPEDPNVPDDAADADDNTPENWIAAMFNEGTAQTDEVLDVMISSCSALAKLGYGSRYTLDYCEPHELDQLIQYSSKVAYVTKPFKAPKHMMPEVEEFMFTNPRLSRPFGRNQYRIDSLDV